MGNSRRLVVTRNSWHGVHLCRATAHCINCHHGPDFTDGQFQNEGLTERGRKQDAPWFPVESPHLRSLGLNQQNLVELKAFSEALPETRVRRPPPHLPRDPN